ncbi:rhodanese-like domain-containing protein [Inhella sp.]|uniref:rhodanese-like domain-containing protein n=1 Tax=Inhella sp. TaxID=1921806 RepID=UPI0035B444AC
MSSVLSFPPADPAETAAYLQAKLRFHADAWDVAEDLSAGLGQIVVIDTRSPEQYATGHVPGALNLRHRDMNPASTAGLDRRKVYITYCDGIGCNGSTKGAFKLASLGFQVKEMLGGLDFWKRDGHPLASGLEPGSMQGQAIGIACAC